MIALSIDVFHSAYIIFGYYKDFPHFAGIPYAFPFLYGPIFYLYAKLISKNSNYFNPKYYLHFIPFFLVVVYGIIFVYLKSSEFKFALIRNELAEPLPGLQMISFFKPVHGIIYVLITIQVVRFYDKKIKNSYSNIERINLNWLLHLTIGLSIVWGIVVLTYIVRAFSTKDINMDQFIYMAASILIYSIGYLSLRQPQIFQPAIKELNAPPIHDSNIKTEVASYQKSGLSDTEAQNHLKNLLKVMATDKLYLNSDLTLRELAEKLSMSPHNLSEILNTRLNQNFYDFINHYRVEEVKRRLADNESEKYSLIAVAFDSGFNSKSSFNTIFKKQTGSTPSQYRKQMLSTK
jgi:AraC-like DNA-binding protein